MPAGASGSRGVVARALESPAATVHARYRSVINDLAEPRRAASLRAAPGRFGSIGHDETHAAEVGARAAGEMIAERRAIIQPAFDFGRMRVHANEEAAEAAHALGARAFAVGEHVVFGRGQFDPHSADGIRLLRHEAAHVIQQSGRPAWIARDPLPQAAPTSRAAEVEALLDRADPIGGVGDPGAAAAVLRDVPIDVLLSTLVELREHARFDQIRSAARSPLRLWTALRAVELAPNPDVKRHPEQWPDLRGDVARLDPIDRSGVLAFLPDAATPSEPIAVPSDLSAPPGSRYAALRAPLVAALLRSYTRRAAGMPGSTANLDNAFWGGRPTSFWTALDALGPMFDIIRQIFERWVRSGLDWSLLDDIHNTWSGGSQGFNFTSPNRAGLEAALDASTNFCADHIGGAYHFIHGETPCWREVIDGGPGLHFCLGDVAPSVHIDPHQVVSGRHDNGYCSYDLGTSISHFQDLGWLPGGAEKE